jgi:predicted DNA-binding transcriptional regulator AlpA
MKPPTSARLPYPPPYQDLATLALHICAGQSTIEQWVKNGLFPAPRKVGGKRLWCWQEVESHLAGRCDVIETNDLARRITEGTRKAVAHRNR